MTPLTPQAVLAVMRRALEFNHATIYETYSETAEAIAAAANDCPLFPDAELETATLLVTIAYRMSAFNPRKISPDGKAFGLFQIIPHQDLTANALLLPRDAARIAATKLRSNLHLSGEYGWHERLGWYEPTPLPARPASKAVALLTESGEEILLD